VRDAGLRSSLAARLSMSSADVLTVENFDDSRIVRGRRRRVVLVADQAAVDGHGGDSERLSADARWQCLVLLTDEPGGDTPRMVHVPRKDAAAAIVAMIPVWQAEGPSF
jgi:hypothetical protein